MTFVRILFVCSLGVLLQSCGGGQEAPEENYLFYFHGGVVTVKGDMGVSDAMPEWGPYEYSRILDSLHRRGFVVISEMRKRVLMIRFM